MLSKMKGSKIDLEDSEYGFHEFKALSFFSNIFTTIFLNDKPILMKEIFVKYLKSIGHVTELPHSLNDKSKVPLVSFLIVRKAFFFGFNPAVRY